MKSRHQVITMFDRISSRYDFANRVLSFGQDLRWRKKVAKFLPKQNNLTVVDLATGSGDQLIALAPYASTLYGFDLSEKMLTLAETKCRAKNIPAHLALGNALAVPIDSASADVVTISFGIRNVTDRIKCLKEMHRILRPGGHALILEFSLPKYRLIRPFALLYLNKLLPKLGGWITKEPHSYQYLCDSIQEFPSREQFLTEMASAQLSPLPPISLSCGMVTLYRGVK